MASFGFAEKSGLLSTIDRHLTLTRSSHAPFPPMRPVLMDCRTSDVDGAARFWGEALGRPVDFNHPSSRGNYQMLETPPDEPIVEIQRVDHESRCTSTSRTTDGPAEVARLTKLGAKVVNRLERWVVMEAPTGQRFCVVRVQGETFPVSRKMPTTGTRCRPY